MNFNEDRTNTHEKGTKRLKEVIMVYEDGTQQVVKATEPTMVLIDYSTYKNLKTVYEKVQDIVTKSKELE